MRPTVDWCIIIYLIMQRFGAVKGLWSIMDSTTVQQSLCGMFVNKPVMQSYVLLTSIPVS